MANRILKDWTQSEKIDKLSEKSEVFFTRLIMKADDFGCYYANSKILKSHLYPLRNIDESKISKMVEECSKAGLIQLYTVNWTNYLKIINFGQRLRQMSSRFPQPADMPPTTVSEPPSNDSTPPPETEDEKKRREDEERKKLHPLQRFVIDNFKNVMLVKKQLTFNEAEKLTSDYPKELLKSKLEGMENYKDLNKKYTSVYLTLKTWIRLDQEKNKTPKVALSGIV